MAGRGRVRRSTSSGGPAPPPVTGSAPFPFTPAS